LFSLVVFVCLEDSPADVRCCGPLFETVSTARSNRSQASGCMSIKSLSIGSAIMKTPKKPRPPPTPKQPKPWDIPPLPIRGDANKQDTFSAVGMALSQWEYFEGYLGLFYGLVVGAKTHTSPSMRAYGAVSTFSTRLDMIKEASSAYFFTYKTDYPDDISVLLEDAKHFAARRNEIAHGIVQPYYAGGLGNNGFALGPSRYATRKRKLKRLEHIGQDGVEELYAYTSEDLRVFVTHFDALANRAMQIWMDVSKLRLDTPSSPKKSFVRVVPSKTATRHSSSQENEPPPKS
jgi:hypothetical protein